MKKIIIVIIGGLFIIPIVAWATTTPSILINEIMYNPAGSDTGHEWLEVFNYSTSTPVVFDSHSRFNDGSNHLLNACQGDLSVQPLHYAIISSNGQTFLQDYPGYQGTVITSSMSLNNTGATLKFSNDNGSTFFGQATYQSSYGANDNGYSLERINLQNTGMPSDWQQSYVLGGTPGQDNSLPVIDNSPKVQIVASNNPGVLGQPIGFTASTTKLIENTINYFWDFGDSATSTGQSTNHTYYQAGVYSVKVSANDGIKQASSSLLITVNQPTITQPINQAIIRINELLPNPVGSDNEKEYLEIFNPGNSTVDLNGWQLADATQRRFTITTDDFPITLVEPNSYFVIYRSESAIAFNNSGDQLTLFRPDGTKADQISYGLAEEGLSYSLESGSWHWTTEQTPGEQNVIIDSSQSVRQTSSASQSIPTVNTITYDPDKFSSLRINEFLANPKPTSSLEWVELYNDASTTINLFGFKLDDEEGGSKPYSFKATTTIAGFGYLVIPKAQSKIALNNDHDEVRLIDPKGEIFEKVSYNKALANQSYNYNLMEDEWYWTDKISPNAPNITNPVSQTTAVAISSLAPDLPTSTNQVLNVNQAQDLPKGEKVKIIGVVTVGPNRLGKNIIYISDDPQNSSAVASGLVVYSSAKNLNGFKTGDVIEVSGKISSAQNQKRIIVSKNDSIVKIDTAPILSQPAIVEDLSDDNLGGLVTISGEITKKTSSGYYLDDGSGEILVAIKKSTNINLPASQVGDQLRVTGILSSTKDGYQLLPRTDTDLAVARVLGAEATNIPSTSSTNLTDNNSSKKLSEVVIALASGGIIVAVGFFIKKKVNK